MHLVWHKVCAYSNCQHREESGMITVEKYQYLPVKIKADASHRNQSH